MALVSILFGVELEACLVIAAIAWVASVFTTGILAARIDQSICGETPIS